MGKRLTTRLVHSSIWIFTKIIVVNFFGIFVIAILARRLTPAEFGIVALAGVVIKLVTVIGSQRVSEFVINDNEEGSEDRVNTAFWMNLAFAGLAMLLGLARISPTANFFSIRSLTSDTVVAQAFPDATSPTQTRYAKI